MVDKKRFRQQCKNYRRSLTEKEWRKKSHRILDRFKAHLELQERLVIHSYIPIEKNREVDTIPLVKKWIKQEQKLAVPKSDFTTLEMEHILLTDLDQLVEQKMGILEPVRGETAHPRDFDLIIVPMVGADVKRNRLGYGKGFYDRFLAKTNGQKVGLCYESCLSGEPITTDIHDVKMDVIITEDRVISHN